MKRYEGVGEVAFIKRAADGLWVRANRPGMPLLLDLITDRVEAGAFTYRVSHENGVVVRTAPGLEAPILKVRDGKHSSMSAMPSILYLLWPAS